jgi:hypothetical protein
MEFVDTKDNEIILPLPDSLARVVQDLSGAVRSGADLLQRVPLLAAAAQAIGGSGPEKLALVERAAHMIVDLYVPAEERVPAHQLVNGVLPSVIRAVLDVSKGNVKIGDAAVAAVVSVASAPETQVAVAGLLSRCLGCLAPPSAEVPAKSS